MRKPGDGTSRTIAQLAAIVLVGLTLWVWLGIFDAHATPSTLYVLDVGQGDGQLVILASENSRSAIKILIDGGRDKTVLTALDEALGNANNKYLDLVILTHTDVDHLGGLIEVARRYDIGMFISNGRGATSEAYRALQKALTERGTKTRALLEGDAIRYGGNNFAILSPDRALLGNKKVNESGIVVMLTANPHAGGVKVLLTADIGFPAEQVLLKKKYDLAADILKVGHHGSKYSSGENFIAAVGPLVSIIGVGKNSYGHPTPRVLQTLERAGSRVYRTDQSGTIKISLSAEGEPVQTQTPRTGTLAAVASIMTGGYKNTGITTVSLRQTREEASTPSKYAQHSQATATAPLQNTPCTPGQININTASKKDLMRIRHIGEARADDIIANRPLYSLAQLRGAVSGIGETRLADIVAEDKACAE